MRMNGRAQDIVTLELRGPGVEIVNSPLTPRQTVETLIPGGTLPLIQVGFQLFGFQVQHEGYCHLVTFINGVESITNFSSAYLRKGNAGTSSCVASSNLL